MLITILLSVLIFFFVKQMAGTGINYISVPAILFPFSYPNLTFSVINSSVFSIVLFVVIIWFLTYKEVGYRFFSYLLVAVSFLYMGYSTVISVENIFIAQASIVNYPIYNSEFNAVNEYVGINEIESFYVCSNDGYAALNYQMFNMDKRVISIRTEEEIEGSLSDYVLIEKNSLMNVHEYDLLMETQNYILVKIKS